MANCSLRQGDEEVNKRIKQKNIYLNKVPNIWFENKPSSGAKRKMEIKLKVFMVFYLSVLNIIFLRVCPEQGI